MRQRYIFIIFIALVLNLLAYSGTMLLFKPPLVHASAYVIGSDPVDGSTIANAPQAVHIYFNAPISTLSNAHVLIVQQGNTLVEVGTNTGVVSESNRNELIIALQTSTSQRPLQGGYLVHWTAIAYDDGRVTFGTIGFNVGTSSTGLSGTPILGPSTSNRLDDVRALDIDHSTNLLIVGWEWIMLAAVTLWIGTLVMEQFILSDRGGNTELRELRTQIHKRVYSLQWLYLTALLFSEFVLFTLRILDIVENTQRNNSYLATLQNLLINTGYGHSWVMAVACTLIAMALLYRINRPGQPRSEAPTENRYPIAWLVLTGLILLALILSRAPGQTFQPHISALVFDWLNLASLGIWFGSFVYLGYLILPLFNNKELEQRVEILSIILQRLTPFILAAIGIEAVCTLFLSEAAISQPQQFFGDPYGRSLLVQIVLFVVMVAMSLYVLSARSDRDKPLPLRVRGDLQPIRNILRLNSTIIVWLGGGVLLCMALMTFFTPPIHFPDVAYSDQTATPTSTTNAQTQQIGNLSVSLQVLPGHSSGANTIVLLINNSAGKPVTNAQIHLTTNMQVMNMGTGKAVINGGNPVYATTFAKNDAFSMAGVWVINVEIQRPNQNAVQGIFYVTLA